LAVLPIYTYGHPLLRKKAKPVRTVDDRIIKLVADMFDTIGNANGIGLAANQVGALDRIIVVDITDMEETKKLPEGVLGKNPIMLLNPEVVSQEGTWVMEEGCLSIPEIRDEVERAETIRVGYKDIEMGDQELVANGLLSRVLLHEIDHLNGVLFIDHLSKVKQKLLRGRLNKIRKGEVEVAYPVVSEVLEVK